MEENGREVGVQLKERPSLKRSETKKGIAKNFLVGSILSLGLLPIVFVLFKKEIARRKKRFTLNRDHLKEIVGQRTAISLAHARLAAIVEYSDDAIISNDLSGNILTWNAGAQRMFGYRPEEIVGKSIRLILPPEKTQEEDQILEVLYRGYPVKNFETVRMSKNGWRLDVSVTSSLLRDDDGHIIGLSKIFRDISDKKLVEEILKRDKETLEKMIKDKSEELVAVQMKLEKLARLSDIGVLAATVAHELRNPLAAIEMATCNIRRKTKEDSLKNHLQTIEKKIAESEQIINNLLFYSRLRPPQYENIELYNFLKECVELNRKQLKKNVEFIENFNGVEGLSIEADPLQLKEVVSNLLHNALDAIDQTGRIVVEASEEGEFVRICIKDNGAGISKENLDRIFEAFFTTKAKGTGLGLTVCRQIIDMHKGKIEITSEMGQGTTVKVLLPKRKSL